MTARLLGHLGAILVTSLLACSAAVAQGYPRYPAAPQGQPGPQPNSAVCVRLESQLAAIDRGGGDARAEQIRRYEAAAAKQQSEIDRSLAQQQRMGCTGGGFFLFGGGQPPQCDRLNAQIDRMRANLNKIIADLQRLQGSGSDQAEQRRMVLIALAQNDCGPQYRAAAAPPRPRGFFEQLFGGGAGAPSGDVGIEPDDVPKASTFRTLCVRTCDGFFFPISFSTVPAKFRDDERVCQRMCPASEVVLFAHRNPGEDVEQAVSINGQPYTSLANAFRYRQEFNPSCSCKRAGESWAEALGGTDSSIERGDIIVTEERAKQMSLPQKPEPARGRDGRRSAAPSAPAEANAPQREPSAGPRGSADDGKRQVRTIGPTFYPVR